MNYILKISKCRRISILINQKAELIVRAPGFVSRDYIEWFLGTKRAWIQKNLDRVKSAMAQKLVVAVGQSVPLFGRQLILDVTTESKAFVADNLLWLPAVGDLQSHLVSFYTSVLRGYLESRVPELAGQMGLQYTKFSVTKAARRLGSCNSKGHLCFSFYNATLPQWVVDYIIVHELAHLRELNHSSRFWQIVAAYYPNFDQAKKYIAENFRTM